jgi:DNA replication and repair protein RecF
MLRSLAVESLSIRDFRNLASVDIELGPRLNVLSGDNGQGKTNLVEAAYVLATSKSFRTAKLPELVRMGATTASVRGKLCEEGERRDQSVGLRTGTRSVRIDGKRPVTLAVYAMRTPAVVFHPGALSLSSGGGTERRRLLDRVALYLSPSSLADAESYGRALRSRQKVLDARGEHAADLDGWEDLIVRHGLALSEARERAFSVIVPAAMAAFERIGAPGVTLGLHYRRGAPNDVESFRSDLAQHRRSDRARRSASVGPHRDDMSIDLAGGPARGMASQGQHRTIVLSLKLAEIEVIAGARGVRPMLLLDDVSSELDRARTLSLFSALSQEQSQVLLTTTRPELIDTGKLGAEGRRDFRVVGGQILAMETTR